MELQGNCVYTTERTEKQHNVNWRLLGQKICGKYLSLRLEYRSEILQKE